MAVFIEAILFDLPCSDPILVLHPAACPILKEQLILFKIAAGLVLGNICEPWMSA